MEIKVKEDFEKFAKSVQRMQAECLLKNKHLKFSSKDNISSIFCSNYLLHLEHHFKNDFDILILVNSVFGEFYSDILNLNFEESEETSREIQKTFMKLISNFQEKRLPQIIEKFRMNAQNHD